MTDESRASILSPLICLAGLSLWAGDAHSYHLDMVLALIRRRGRKGKHIPFAHSISAHTCPCPAVWLTARLRIAGRRGESTFATSYHRKTSSQQCLRAAQPATTYYTNYLRTKQNMVRCTSSSCAMSQLKLSSFRVGGGLRFFCQMYVTPCAHV